MTPAGNRAPSSSGLLPPTDKMKTAGEFVHPGAIPEASCRSHSQQGIGVPPPHADGVAGATECLPRGNSESPGGTLWRRGSFWFREPWPCLVQSLRPCLQPQRGPGPAGRLPRPHRVPRGPLPLPRTQPAGAVSPWGQCEVWPWGPEWRWQLPDSRGWGPGGPGPGPEPGAARAGQTVAVDSSPQEWSTSIRSTACRPGSSPTCCGSLTPTSSPGSPPPSSSTTGSRCCGAPTSWATPSPPSP